MFSSIILFHIAIVFYPVSFNIFYCNLGYVFLSFDWIKTIIIIIIIIIMKSEFRPGSFQPGK